MLREIHRSDTENIVRWRNNPKVKENLYSGDVITVESHIRYFEKYIQTGKVRQYIIVSEDQQDIGTVFLKNIDLTCRKAEFGIFIGEDSARKKGYAFAAAKDLLKIGFDELRLHRIYLSVMADNLPAIICYLKAGFKIEGRLLEDYCKNGKYIDVILMGITEKQWRESLQNNE